MPRSNPNKDRSEDNPTMDGSNNIGTMNLRDFAAALLLPVTYKEAQTMQNITPMEQAKKAASRAYFVVDELLKAR